MDVHCGQEKTHCICQPPKATEAASVDGPRWKGESEWAGLEYVEGTEIECRSAALANLAENGMNYSWKHVLDAIVHVRTSFEQGR